MIISIRLLLKLRQVVFKNEIENFCRHSNKIRLKMYNLENAFERANYVR